MKIPHKVEAILFDKDGTLFDFHATWGAWSANILKRLAGDDADLLSAMAAAIDFDLKAQKFLPQSPAIAGSGAEIATVLAPHLPDQSIDAICAVLDDAAMDAPLCPVLGMTQTLAQLKARGIILGVMTNDSYAPAKAHLKRTGASQYLDFIAGADSGYGAKPSPAPLLAFCQAMDVRPETALMIGDSSHDLLAANAAGMIAIGVLTGPATATALSPYTPYILPSIKELPNWLDEFQPS